MDGTKEERELEVLDVNLNEKLNLVTRSLNSPGPSFCTRVSGCHNYNVYEFQQIITRLCFGPDSEERRTRVCSTTGTKHKNLFL